PPNLYLQRRSFRCKLGRDVCSPDRNAECRTQRSAPDLPTRLPAREHWVAVTRERSLRGREADQPPLQSLFFLLREGVSSDELPFLHFNQPAERCLEGRGAVVEVVAVERHPHLESQRIARAESGRSDFSRCGE